MSLIYNTAKNYLTNDQKQSIGLLSIGTFLEYFDLMLYVHMAVLLNDLFFPKSDPHMSSILSAFAFCSTFVFRPFGGLIFGWIGDNIGRKATVVLTTLLMAISCIVMAIIPTYSDIGITATYIVTICRILQGMSSMGEAISAELYLTETIKPPMQYPAVALVSVFIAIGMMAALGVASLVTSFGLNWRYAFWIGALIAIVGTNARTKLRETPDFVDAKKMVKKAFKDINLDQKNLEKSLVWKEKVNKKTALSLFLIQCSWPACFYFVYFHCGTILKTSFLYSSTEIIHHNFILSIVQLVSVLLLTYLSYYIYPMKIVKFKLVIFSILTIFCPILLKIVHTPFELLIFQSVFILFISSTVPAVPIFFEYFPVFKRFTYTGVSYALSRAVIYIVTSFGFVYVTESFGNWGILFILLPVNIGFAFGFRHFEKLVKNSIPLVK